MRQGRPLSCQGSGCTVQGPYIVLLTFLFSRGCRTTCPAGKQDANKEDCPAESHNQPENVFHSQAGCGAGKSNDECTGQDQNIRPKQCARTLAAFHLPGGIDGHASYSCRPECSRCGRTELQAHW